MRKDQILSLSVLCYVNFINYMDRFNVAGILPDIEKQFNLSSDQTGMLQTVFIISYMICAPIFGYLGDRYNRRLIMVVGVLLWSFTTLVGSFMEKFLWFLLSRACVGVGEASYTTIAPTIISDLFPPRQRLKVIAIFYFAIPVGSGFGYIIGSQFASLTGCWRNGLRVTPVLGLVGVIMIIFFINNPERGQSEGAVNLNPTPWTTDMYLLLRNPSFMFSTVGFTCVTFVTGALGWWGPYYIYLGLRLQSGNENATHSNTSLNFGLIAMITGLLGVTVGSSLAQTLRGKYPRVGPYICAYGLIISAPFCFLAIICASSSTLLTLVLIFFAELFLNLNWSIVADILFDVIIPNRRSSAEAFQITFSHLFGDAGSPYFIGLMSEILKKYLSANTKVEPSNTTIAEDDGKQSLEVKFRSLQYALCTTVVIEVLGALFFLLNAFYLEQDKNKADEEIAERYRRQTSFSSIDEEQKRGSGRGSSK